MAISESVTEQYKDELGFDPKIHSLRSCAAVQAFVKALEKSGTLDSSVEIDILKSVEKLDSVIDKFSFNELVIFGGCSCALPGRSHSDWPQVCYSLLTTIRRSFKKTESSWKGVASNLNLILIYQ